MTQNLLDKHDGARRYVAHLHSYGATREQICTKLSEKYPTMRKPTPRSMTAWLNNDPELVKMIADLAAIKADLAPDDPTLAELPEPVDQAEVVRDFWLFLDAHRAFAMLCHRADLDPDVDDDAPLRVFLETDPSELEAASAALVGDWDVHEALGAEPGYQERVGRVMAAA